MYIIYEASLHATDPNLSRLDHQAESEPVLDSNQCCVNVAYWYCYVVLLDGSIVSDVLIDCAWLKFFRFLSNVSFSD